MRTEITYEQKQLKKNPASVPDRCDPSRLRTNYFVSILVAAVASELDAVDIR